MVPESEVDRLMGEAMVMAREGLSVGDVPIGSAVGLWDGAQMKVIARGRNLGSLRRNYTAHAEMVALEQVTVDQVGEIVLATTLEPCLMCFGAALVCGVREIHYALPAPGDFGATAVSLPLDGLYAPPAVCEGPGSEEAREMWDEWLEGRDSAFIRRLLGR